MNKYRKIFSLTFILSMILSSNVLWSVTVQVVSITELICKKYYEHCSKDSSYECSKTGLKEVLAILDDSRMSADGYDQFLHTYSTWITTMLCDPFGYSKKAKTDVFCVLFSLSDEEISEKQKIKLIRFFMDLFFGFDAQDTTIAANSIINRGALECAKKVLSQQEFLNYALFLKGMADKKWLYSAEGLAALYNSLKNDLNMTILINVLRGYEKENVNKKGVNVLFHAILTSNFSVENKMYIIEKVLEAFIAKGQKDLFDAELKKDSFLSVIFDYYLKETADQKNKEAEDVFKSFCIFFKKSEFLAKYRWKLLLSLWCDMFYGRLQYHGKKNENKTIRDFFRFALNALLSNKKAKLDASLLTDLFVVDVVVNTMCGAIENDKSEYIDYFIEDLGVDFDKDTGLVIEDKNFNVKHKGTLICHAYNGIFITPKNTISHDSYQKMMQLFCEKVAKYNLKSIVIYYILDDLYNKVSSEQLKKKYSQEELKKCLDMFFEGEYFHNKTIPFYILFEAIEDFSLSFDKYKGKNEKIVFLLRNFNLTNCTEDVYKKLFSGLTLQQLKNFMEFKKCSDVCRNLLKELYSTRMNEEQKELSAIITNLDPKKILEKAREDNELHVCVAKLIQKYDEDEEMRKIILSNITEKDCLDYKGKNVIACILGNTSVRHTSKYAYIEFIVKNTQKYYLNLLLNDETSDSPLMSFLSIWNSSKYDILLQFMISKGLSFKSLQWLKANDIKSSKVIGFFQFLHDNNSDAFDRAVTNIPNSFRQDLLLAIKIKKNNE